MRRRAAAPARSLRRRQRPVRRRAALLLAEDLNNTEFALFFLNYHSRLPLISGYSITNSSPNSGRVFNEYPEDIRLYGLSFNTDLEADRHRDPGRGQYRANVPLQIDDVEVLFTALTPLNGLIPQPYNRFISQLGSSAPVNTEIQGYERHELSQWQFTLTKTFADVMGAEQIALVGEFGGTKVWDLPDPAILRYQGDGTDTGGGPDVNYRRRPQPADPGRRLPDQLFVGLPPRRPRRLQQRVRHLVQHVAAPRVQLGRQRHHAGSWRQLPRGPQVGDPGRGDQLPQRSGPSTSATPTSTVPATST